MLCSPPFIPHTMSSSRTIPPADYSSEPELALPAILMKPASNVGEATSREDEKEGGEPDECCTPKADEYSIPAAAATCPGAPRKPRPAPKRRRGSLAEGGQLISVGEQELRELFFPSHHLRAPRIRADPPPNGCGRKRRRWEFDGEGDVD